MAAAAHRDAIDRIEAALARIERASAAAASADGALRDRHERLRGVVAQSLRQLDALLVAHAGGDRAA